MMPFAQQSDDTFADFGNLFAAIGGKETRPMQEDEIKQLFSSPAGFLGPVGIEWAKKFEEADRPVLLVDKALEGRRNLISGANKEDHHLKNVTPGENFQATAYADLRSVTAGEGCPSCGNALRIDTAVEIGHIFKLGYKYSDALGLHVTNERGQEIPPIMGSYGIGLERILSAAVELYNDKDGMALPPAIAPFTTVITPVNFADRALREAAETIYSSCVAAGIDTVLDDRDERPGVKFKDADLAGIPYRVTVGKKVPQGLVEVVERRTHGSQDIPIAGVAAHIRERLCL